MECDSVHSTIENSHKNKPIYSPHNYVDIMEFARQSLSYNVKYLTHNFTDFTDLSYYTSIRPGTNDGDPVVTDLCSLCFKLNYCDEYRDIPKRATRRAD